MTGFLTEGAIRRIVDASSCTTGKDDLEKMRTYYPTLQIVASYHPETLDKRAANALISDGTHSIMSSFQSTALQQSDDVQTGTIVQLFDYELSQNTAQDGRRLVVYEACVRYSARPMIGDPSPIEGNLFGLQSSDSQDDDVADNDDNIEDDQALIVAPGTSRSVMVSPARSSSSCRTSAINAAAREFLCPISFSLPIDAVVAEDGRVYNRADIQQHIDTVQSSHRRKMLRSPITNEPMGPKLLPAVQIRNSIRALIDSGSVEGDIAENWKVVDDTRTAADNGDTDAMHALALWLSWGSHGLQKNDVVAYDWLEKAAALGCIKSLAMQGERLLTGRNGGDKKDKVEGAFLLGIAAAKGSEYAAFTVGKRHYHGRDGFPRNLQVAKHWLESFVKGQCEVKDCHNRRALLSAQMLLQKINGNLA